MNYIERFTENLKKAFTENLVVSILDIVFAAILLYLLFAFLKKNNSSRLIIYIVAALLVSAVLSSELLGFKLMDRVFEYTVIVCIMVLILMYPQEIRRSIHRLASSKDESDTFTTKYDCSDEELESAIAEIVRAVQNMAKKNVGALIIIAPDDVPEHILESGTALDSKLSCGLLESIFNTKAPLHDGAVFIRGNRIIAAGCFLPLSQNLNIDKELGTRHRAAIGVTESNKVTAIIVSEETGVISTAEDGEITRYYDSPMLTAKLEQIYGLKAVGQDKKKKKRKRA